MSNHSLCLRCGFCCLFYRVPFPNGRAKPGGMPCPYLIPRKKLGRRWRLASCKIYDSSERPEACSRFCGGCTILKEKIKKCPEEVCPEGLRTWRELKEENPNDEFPPEIEKYLVI